MRVFSLGKENNADVRGWRRGFARIVYALRLVRYIIRERGNYDAVFVHMNPEYAILGGLFWRLAGKKSALWYVHKKVSWRLRFAALLVNKIFTASKESCRLRNKKVTVVGHGIDTELFAPLTTPIANPSALRLLTAGRISPVKDISTLILGFYELEKKLSAASIRIAIFGQPITESDKRYKEELEELATAHSNFTWGYAYHDNIRKFYHGVESGITIFVHASKTGSMDKAVLEALAAGLPVFTSSEAFNESMGVIKFRPGDPVDLAEKVSRAFLRKELVVNEKGKAYVRENHSLNRLAQKIISFYE